MNKDSKIFVAGHNGMVGSALIRKLQADGYYNLALKSRSQLDLEDQNQTRSFFENEKPEYIFLAAAKVGGIMSNLNHKADFIYSNLQIQNNIIYNSWRFGVKKLLFLGSSCIYPKLCEQPIKEEYLLSGYLEETNDAYAIAKIAGIKMCQSFNKQYGTNFISVMPTNLYGINDNFNSENAHVIPAMMRKFYEANTQNNPTIELWGNGEAKREFLYVDDLAEACVHLMNNYDESEIINIGTGSDLSIKKLAEIIRNVVGYRGEIRWDARKPDGTPRKLLDISKIKSRGWSPRIGLDEGLKLTYDWFVKNYGLARK